ncbi:hypothetical protein KQI69_07870 [Eubacterium sp. MSJ-13]|uniref:hypothetical protein n=1 Tax=Eubacterium sp. MSJ-13 TaxID=2841513 RepID=UPI001C11F712|nr:hypothetical protein [Eubacterium sp. MSJ-13]MBU5479119.1 hypothetical protein [Eubacterium sp. MSJ-13]
MKTMFFPVFRTIYKKKEAKICLSFCVLPLLLIITSLLPTNFMQLSGDVGAMSCMEFFEAVIYVQFQLTLPSIAFMYLAITCIHDEIKKGSLYLYKDIPRIKVFLCKSFSLLVWYAIYFVSTFLTSVFTYYVYIIKQPYASGKFLPTKWGDVQYVIISMIGTILAIVISLLLVIVLSTFLNNGVSLIIGILFSLFCSIAPNLEKINVLFPTGFLYKYKSIGFSKAIVFILLICVIYLCVIGAVGRYKIKRIEF